MKLRARQPSEVVGGEAVMARNVLAGCIAHARNRETGTMTAVFIAAEQGIDADSKYVVVCDDHGTILEAATSRDALYCRAHPTLFCDECREIKASNEAPTGFSGA